MSVCVAVGGSNGSSCGRHVYIPCLCVLQRVEAMAVAVADMFTFHVCVCVAVGGSNGRSCLCSIFVCCSGWKQWQKLFMFHICVLQWVEAMAEAVYVPYLCVAVGGSNGRSCLCSIFVCCSGWKQWQKLFMFHICVLQWVEAMVVAGADMFTFHVCVCCSGWKQWQ